MYGVDAKVDGGLWEWGNRLLRHLSILVLQLSSVKFFFEFLLSVEFRLQIYMNLLRLLLFALRTKCFASDKSNTV